LETNKFCTFQLVIDRGISSGKQEKAQGEKAKKAKGSSEQHSAAGEGQKQQEEKLNIFIEMN
jgi:hypothetical protein